MLQGQATFPGISSIVEASISFVHGISPSVATLTIKPQLDFVPKIGPLRFSFGRDVVEFPDCTVDYASLQRNDRGEVWRLSLFDRRWRWKFGNIAGSYNVREEDEKTIKRDTEKTPHQLAELCFAAIGETGYSLADLPNESRPAIIWDGMLPVEALAQLCDSLGCRVVLGIDNRVRIEKFGEGEPLPLNGVLERSFGYDSPELADDIAALGGRTRHQLDFELEAIGKEIDGSIELIDDLSYKPSSGWIEYAFFDQVRDEFGEVKHELALQTVYRWYRIKTPLTLPWNGNRVSDLDHLVIETEQVETITSENVKRRLPAWAYGIWCKEPDDGSVNNNVLAISPVTGLNDAQIIKKPFTIDTRRGIVRFSQPVFRNTMPGLSDVTPGEATLRLRVACTVRNETTWAWERLVVPSPNVDKVQLIQYLRHDEIVLATYPTYNNQFGVVRMNSNQTEVKKEAQYYIDGAWPLLQPVQSETITYMGLRTDIGLDGAIQHIVYSVGPRGATTTIARNNEILHRVLPHKERRRIERQRRAEEAQKELQGVDWRPTIPGIGIV